MATAFLRKFENRISVTNRDGSISKVGEPAAPLGLACNSPGVSHLHPALLATDLGGPSGGNAWPVMRETTMQSAQMPSSPQRMVRGKPTAAELEVRAHSPHRAEGAPVPHGTPQTCLHASHAAPAASCPWLPGTRCARESTF